MSQSLCLVTLIVREYDEAIGYFTRILGFELIEDTKRSERKRWVVVGPMGGKGAKLLLAKAANYEQEASIGRQTAGRVGFFLETNNLERDFAEMGARGVKFIEAPRREPYGKVVKFADLYGNLWDLIQLA